MNENFKAQQHITVRLT